MNVKVFNLISRVNQTWFLVQDDSCECKYRCNCKSVKVYVTVACANGILMNVDVNVNN